jgi:NADH:ubiquinone oxidoreductase subunit 6 (subunit J)
MFPELNGILNKFVLAMQAVGVVLLVAMIALIALMILTSFGSEHRVALARGAALGVIIGFALLMLAPTVSVMIQRVFPAVAPK